MPESGSGETQSPIISSTDTNKTEQEQNPGKPKGGIPPEIFHPGFDGIVSGNSGHEKLECKIGTGVISIVDLNNPDLKFLARIDRDNHLILNVNNKDDSDLTKKHPDIYPSELMEQAFAYFQGQGKKIEKIQGLWSSGKPFYDDGKESKPSDNHNQYVEYLSQFNPEDITEEIKKEAALHTWTGKQAQKFGFTEVESIDDDALVAESLEKMNLGISVLFSKPKEQAGRTSSPTEPLQDIRTEKAASPLNRIGQKITTETE